MTYPYDSFPTQLEAFGCYFPSLDHKAVREACYSNDGGDRLPDFCWSSNTVLSGGSDTFLHSCLYNVVIAQKVEK